MVEFHTRSSSSTGQSLWSSSNSCQALDFGFCTPRPATGRLTRVSSCCFHAAADDDDHDDERTNERTNEQGTIIIPHRTHDVAHLGSTSIRTSRRMFKGPCTLPQPTLCLMIPRTRSSRSWSHLADTIQHHITPLHLTPSLPPSCVRVCTRGRPMMPGARRLTLDRSSRSGMGRKASRTRSSTQSCWPSRGSCLSFESSVRRRRRRSAAGSGRSRSRCR